MVRPVNSSPTHGRIRQLDPAVANQIAAGEVVERPSSVVKELIENSLDAGATQITIRLQEGGRVGIQIIDDGHGMGPSDAHLAFARHATSKIVDADELMRIGTYGFRGEALASILSVARVVLCTRRADDELGVRLEGAGGCELTARAVSCPVGTDLRIDDLFFNVPARQKFLRTAATELGHIIRLIDAVALAHPGLRLELTQGGRRICLYPAVEGLAERAAAVFGDEVAPHLYGVTGAEDYAVDGQLSAPSTHRGSATGLIFLVDGRPVRDRTLQHAVVQAYGALLSSRRFPVGVLRLRCPPGTVDVNVHPAKTEVRFVSSQAVHRAVGRAVRGMLIDTPWVEREVVGERSAPYDLHTPSPASAPRAPRASVRRPSGVSNRTNSPPHATWRGGDAPRQPDRASTSPAALAPSSLGAAGLVPTATPRSYAPTPSPLIDDEFGVSAREVPAQTGWSGRMCDLRYVGQVGRRCLVFDDGDAMVLIDQHAAHERVLLDRFVAAFQTGGFPRQRMLIPRVVPLGPTASAALLAQPELTAPLGFELAPAGERAVMVRAFPDVLRLNQVDEEIRRLASLVLNGDKDGTADARDAGDEADAGDTTEAHDKTEARDEGETAAARLARAAATLACHAAVRAGEIVTAAWVDGLMPSLAGVDLAAYCPHGRPALSRLPLDDIGRLLDPS